MKIGFDFEKVIIDYPPFIPNWIIDKFYKQRDNGILLYRIPGKYEQMLRTLIHLPPLRQPITKNLEAIKELAKNSEHELFIISSRFGFLKKITENLTSRLALEKIFKRMYFNYENEQPHHFKNRIVKELKIDKYIDDDLSLLKFLAKENPQTVFFWLNGSIKKKLSDNLVALTHIDDLEKII